MAHKTTPPSATPKEIAEMQARQAQAAIRKLRRRLATVGEHHPYRAFLLDCLVDVGRLAK